MSEKGFKITYEGNNQFTAYSPNYGECFFTYTGFFGFPERKGCGVSVYKDGDMVSMFRTLHTLHDFCITRVVQSNGDYFFDEKEMPNDDLLKDWANTLAKEIDKELRASYHDGSFLTELESYVYKPKEADSPKAIWGSRFEEEINKDVVEETVYSFSEFYRDYGSEMTLSLVKNLFHDFVNINNDSYKSIHLYKPVVVGHKRLRCDFVIDAKDMFLKKNGYNNQFLNIDNVNVSYESKHSKAGFVVEEKSSYEKVDTPMSSKQYVFSSISIKMLHLRYTNILEDVLKSYAKVLNEHIVNNFSLIANSDEQNTKLLIEGALLDESSTVFLMNVMNGDFGVVFNHGGTDEQNKDVATAWYNLFTQMKKDNELSFLVDFVNYSYSLIKESDSIKGDIKKASENLSKTMGEQKLEKQISIPKMSDKEILSKKLEKFNFDAFYKVHNKELLSPNKEEIYNGVMVGEDGNSLYYIRLFIDGVSLTNVFDLFGSDNSYKVHQEIEYFLSENKIDLKKLSLVEGNDFLGVDHLNISDIKLKDKFKKEKYRSVYKVKDKEFAPFFDGIDFGNALIVKEPYFMIGTAPLQGTFFKDGERITVANVESDLIIGKKTGLQKSDFELVYGFDVLNYPNITKQAIDSMRNRGQYNVDYQSAYSIKGLGFITEGGSFDGAFNNVVLLGDNRKTAILGGHNINVAIQKDNKQIVKEIDASKLVSFLSENGVPVDSLTLEYGRNGKDVLSNIIQEFGNKNKTGLSKDMIEGDSDVVMEMDVRSLDNITNIGEQSLMSAIENDYNKNPRLVMEDYSVFALINWGNESIVLSKINDAIVDGVKGEKTIRVPNYEGYEKIANKYKNMFIKGVEANNNELDKKEMNKIVFDDSRDFYRVFNEWIDSNESLYEEILSTTSNDTEKIQELCSKTQSLEPFVDGVIRFGKLKNDDLSLPQIVILSG